MKNEKAKFGLPENYQTWPERILNYFEKHPNKWRTQKQVRKALGVRYYPGVRSYDRVVHPLYSQYTCFNQEIRRLVLHGIIIRANAPDFLKTKARNLKFVYKWTGETKKPNYRQSIVRRGKDFKILLDGL